MRFPFSLKISTSLASTWNSFGSLTACEFPDLKIFAVLIVSSLQRIYKKYIQRQACRQRISKCPAGIHELLLRHSVPLAPLRKKPFPCSSPLHGQRWRKIDVFPARRVPVTSAAGNCFTMRRITFSECLPIPMQIIRTDIANHATKIPSILMSHFFPRLRF
jgi:hypothetical protein